ncbi:MAG: DsbA family protein [Elusimicrobiota bacterium]
MSRYAARLLCVLLAAPAMAAVSREDLKKALTANPDLVLEALKNSKKSDFFEFIMDAQKEYQQTKMKEEEALEKAAYEKAFADPYKPVIDAKAHVRGDANAPITIVEYSDFQCPFCTRGSKTMEEVRKKYGAKVRLVFKHEPTNQRHPEALPAALWMEAVALQSREKAWLFHDKLFENQDKLGDEFYRKTVKDLGLDAAKAAKDKDSKPVQEKIAADVRESQEFGFRGTPGFLVNGVPLRGAYPIADFDKIIERLSR